MAGSLVVGGQLGSYLIESVAGRGGMSVIYRARHTRLGTVVALKVLAPELSTDDEFRERFLREARTAAGIDHPNVIPIFDTGLHEGSLYIVMRYVSGGDLKGEIRRAGALTPVDAVELLSPVARALDAAHARGLVHRDVKPANILLQRTPDGEIEHVYLSDFGITKHTSGSESGLTAADVVVGTVAYMAPEQIEGKTVSAETDVYALACVLYECITGQLPFQRNSEASAMYAHVREPAPAPSTVREGIPSAVDEAVMRAMAKEPAERFASCEAFTRACAGAAPPAPVAAPAPVPAPEPRVPPAAPPPPPRAAPPTPPAAPPQRSWLARHWWQAGLGIALVAGAFAAGAVLTSSDSSSPATSTEAPGDRFPGTLRPIPTNRVTGDGNAEIRLDGDVATVTITTPRLLDSAPHAIHIHANGQGRCPPATAAREHEGHLAISTTNGIPYYGSPVLALTTR